MDISLKHIIGTVSLLGLMISIGLSYAIITSYIEVDVTKQQLSQISEYVSLNLVEMTNLCRLANRTMIKQIELPNDLTGKAYGIKLLFSEDEGYYVRCYLVSRENVFSDSFLPFNINPQESPVEFEIGSDVSELPIGDQDTQIFYSNLVYGGNDVVVWGAPLDEIRMHIGIGWIPQGGI